MMVKNKLIQARKAKYTQENMAKILHMTQSQYQRREKGDIKISDEEWERIAKALDTNVENQQEYINLLKKEIQDLKEEIKRLKSE
ncbi:MAG: transcriptional regulator [Chryseobacterium sp.]|jgi:transcriptional regulator with XRE-family HTH domain|nr:transcriptional regulator [Chryseobacterium sp.]